jgi:predicted transcriptional regulator
MTHVETAPHECEGNLIFTEHGLSPYWIIGKLLTSGFDGHFGEIETDIDGETWRLSLSYQKSGIAPRPSDDVGGDRLYEYRISASGEGERKANYLIQPRFEDMRHYETGESISTPFDHINEEGGVNVRFSGSNLEPGTFRLLLPEFVQELSLAGEIRVNQEYFAGPVHEMSNITTYERYIRLHRNWSEKLVGRAGVMQRLMHLCATEEGSEVEYRVDNEEIVGYNHRVILPKQDAQRLISGHRYGKQIKHYHPKHVREEDETDPLYHPKVGVLLKKSLTGHSFSWSDRRELRQEIDEILINVLRWSDIPIQADQTTFVPDTHFAAREAEDSVSLHSDPTPEMEANQEALLVTVLRDLCESDVEVLETLVTDGGQQHPQELANKTDRGLSTIYRALERMKGIVRNENASVTFASKKYEQEIAAIVESVEHQIENAADRTAKILNLESRGDESSAWQEWCQKYAAKITEVTEDGKRKIRIDTILSELKSTPHPRVQDVLHEAVAAWRREGRDPLDLLEATVKWRISPDGWKQGTVKPMLR